MPGPLSDITVFDMTHAAVGPWATMLLAGLGANVIKIEPPDGDLIHNIPPKQRGHGVVYAHCNLGKRSIKLNLKDEADRAKAYDILKHCDIFIENFRSGVADRIGFGMADVRRINPSILYVSSSAWGHTGPMSPMSGADGPIQAFSGFVSLNGELGGPGEYFRHYGYVDLNTSQIITLAILEALVRRGKTRRGLRVDTTMLGSSLWLQYTRIAEYLGGGQAPQRWGSASPAIVPEQAFLCQDKAYLAVAATTDAQWRGLCAAIGADTLAEDPRYVTNPARVQHRTTLIPALEAIFATKPRRWWQIQLLRHGVPHGRFQTFEEIRNHRQVRDNRFVISLDIPHQGQMHFGALPWSFSDTPLEVRPPPASGQHTVEILDEYATKPAPDHTPAGDLPAGHTLAGLTVVDITQGIAGPFAAHFLAELGAHIIKAAPPGGDPSRAFGPPFLPDGDSPAHFALNRLKERVAIDPDSPADLSRLRDLLRTADVFLEDLPPAQAETLGLDYASLATVNPGLVHCAITPFGEKGPLAEQPASELVIQAMADCWSGLGALDEAPERMGADVASLNTGMSATQAILAALYARQGTGRGQRVAVSMYGTALHMRGLSWAAQSDPDKWEGYHVEHPVMPRNTGYRTTDIPVFFAMDRATEEEFAQLAIALGMEDALADPRFDHGGRYAVGTRVYAHQVKHIWERAFVGRSSAEVIALINRYKGEAVPVNDLPSLFAHPQLDALGIVATVPDPGGAPVRVLRLPWQIEGLPHVT